VYLLYKRLLYIKDGFYTSISLPFIQVQLKYTLAFLFDTVYVAGLLGVSIAAEHGGIGGSWADECVVLEEQAYAHCHAPAITVHSSIVLPYIVNYGTEEQKEKYDSNVTNLIFT
jgi:alkylation response protein AidB-like acyl-CoA dehydrogenase